MIFINKVKVVRFSVCTTLLLIILAGCNTGIKGNPTPKDYLGNAGADIFVLDDIVHSNAQDVDWIQDLDYRVVEQVAEITKKTGKA